MLSLTRRENESITIGDNIKVQIVKIQSNQVIIGIEAPRQIPILRDNAREREKHKSTKNKKFTGHVGPDT